MRCDHDRPAGIVRQRLGWRAEAGIVAGETRRLATIKNDNNESYSIALVKQAIFERQIYTIAVKR